MKLLNRDSWFVINLPVAGPLVIIGVTAWFMRSEIMCCTSGTQRENTSREAMRLLNEWNPTLAMPRIDDILAGGPVRPMEKNGSIYPIIGECSTVRFAWESGFVDVDMKRTGDGSDPFIDRTVSEYQHLSSSVPPTSRR